MFTQRSRDAITVTWKTCHFTLKHYKVSKSEVVEKVTPATPPIFESLLMACAKNCKKNWWMSVKAIASHTWDVFLRHKCISCMLIEHEQPTGLYNLVFPLFTVNNHCTSSGGSNGACSRSSTRGVDGRRRSTDCILLPHSPLHCMWCLQRSLTT